MPQVTIADATGQPVAYPRLDSFDLTMLVSALEERLGVGIDGADIVPENFRNVKAITALMERYGVAG